MTMHMKLSGHCSASAKGGSMRTFTLGICACFLTLSLGWSPLVWADAVTDWNANAGKAAIAACIDPFHESRMYAMMHIAIHDAVNAINRRFQPYLLDLLETSGASVEAAVATAARDVLVPLLGQLPDIFSACIDAVIASVETDYTAALDAIAYGTSKTQGIVIGRDAAAAILALRVADGADTLFLDPDYPQGTNPGEYRFTPGTPFAAAPGWGDVTPFVLKDSAQFRPGPPYDVTSKKYTADFNEIKSLGAKDNSARTDEQTEIAHFWVESSPLQWNRIARTVSTAAERDLWQKARSYGLLTMAIANGCIGSMTTKYHYNSCRPVTAIQLAETDDNPNTAADLDWEPLEPTPPIPDYDSAHSVEGGVAAEVLQRVF